MCLNYTIHFRVVKLQTIYLFRDFQIALFYVAVLAGLLHRFPVTFSQVWDENFFLLHLLNWTLFILIGHLLVFSIQLVKLGTVSLGVLVGQKSLNKANQLLLLMLLVLMRLKRS